MSERDWATVVRALRAKADAEGCPAGEQKMLRDKATELEDKYGPFTPSLSSQYLPVGMYAPGWYDWLDDIVDNRYLYDE